MAQLYNPELDAMNGLYQDKIITFQELIGILQWEIEIGRLGILFEVSNLSSYQAEPREGRLDQIYHIFDYFKNNTNPTLYFYPQDPNIDPS